MVGVSCVRKMLYIVDGVSEIGHSTYNSWVLEESQSGVGYRIWGNVCWGQCSGERQIERAWIQLEPLQQMLNLDISFPVNLCLLPMFVGTTRLPIGTAHMLGAAYLNFML